MKRKSILGRKGRVVSTAIALAGAANLVACAGEVVVERPHGCEAGVWVHGHRNRYGEWVPGHWDCEPHRHVVVVGAD